MTLVYPPYIGLNCPEIESPEDLLEGILPARGLGFLVGDPGVGKSFLCLKLCASLATLTPFIHDSHPLKLENPYIGNVNIRCGSIYIAGEREGRLPDRQMALIESLQLDPDFAESGLPIITCPVRNAGGFGLRNDIPYFTRDLRKSLSELNLKPRLIILDTLQSAISPANENGNSEMQLVMNHLRELARQLDCFILIVTHPAQAYGRGAAYSVKGVPRGASSMRGTADIIWYLEKSGKNGLHKMTVTKGSEGYCEGHSFFFTLTPFLDSAALVPVQAPAERTYENSDEDGIELTQKDIGVLKAMEQTFIECGHISPFHEEICSQAVTRADVQAILKKLHTEEAHKAKQKPVGDSGIGNRISRAIERLIELGLISKEDSDDGETIYYPPVPWHELGKVIQSKFRSVNFANVGFL